MRHDMDTQFYKKSIAYDAREIIKMLTKRYGGEWSFDMYTDGKTKRLTIFNVTGISDYRKGKVVDSEMFWGPTCHSYGMRGGTWIDLAENVSNLRCFGMNLE